MQNTCRFKCCFMPFALADAGGRADCSPKYSTWDLDIKAMWEKISFPI